MASKLDEIKIVFTDGVPSINVRGSVYTVIDGTQNIRTTNYYRTVIDYADTDTHINEKVYLAKSALPDIDATALKKLLKDINKLV